MGSSPSHRASMKRRAGSRQRLSSIANNYIVVEIDGKHAVVKAIDSESGNVTLIVDEKEYVLTPDEAADLLKLLGINAGLVHAEGPQELLEQAFSKGHVVPNMQLLLYGLKPVGDNKDGHFEGKTHRMRCSLKF